MEDDYLILNYTGGVPGADSNTYVLFDSVTTSQITERSQTRFDDYRRYLLSLKNAQPGTLRASSSNNKGTVWQSFFELAVAPATAQRNNSIAIPLEPHVDVKIEWINGGLAQSTFYLQHALDGLAASGSVFGDSVAMFSAASLRGALRGEPYPITVTATSKTFVVPTAWKGKIVRIQAETADVYYVISVDATLAVVDKAVAAGEAGNPIVLTAPVGGSGRIAKDQWQDIPFPSASTTFALQGSAAGVARCHLAET